MESSIEAQISIEHTYFWCSSETMSIIIIIITKFAETRNDETSAEQQPGFMRIADTAQDIYWEGSRREVQTAD